MYFVFRYEQLKHKERKQTAKSLEVISSIVVHDHFSKNNDFFLRNPLKKQDLWYNK